MKIRSVDQAVKFAKDLERAHDWDGAIRFYSEWIEQLPNAEVEAPYPYERLAIIHRKRRDRAAEIK
ncbi:MAG: hypothetical protein MUQ65_17535, partial [Armatimonadetes bacterium]|nr:hypothetical protein [Armatimonadota bacterium]